MRLFINTFNADEKYSLVNRDNLALPIQMQLSEKLKMLSQFFGAILKSRLNFEHFQRKDDPHRALPFDHPRLSKSINSEDDLEFLGTQDTPPSSLTLKNMLDVSTQATNKISSLGYEIEFQDINAKMMALKTITFPKITDLLKIQCYGREN